MIVTLLSQKGRRREMSKPNGLSPYEKLSDRLKKYSGHRVQLTVFLDDYGVPFALCMDKADKLEVLNDEWKPPRVNQNWGGVGEPGGRQ